MYFCFYEIIKTSKGRNRIRFFHVKNTRINITDLYIPTDYLKKII